MAERSYVERGRVIAVKTKSFVEERLANRKKAVLMAVLGAGALLGSCSENQGQPANPQTEAGRPVTPVSVLASPEAVAKPATKVPESPAAPAKPSAPTSVPTVVAPAVPQGAGNPSRVEIIGPMGEAIKVVESQGERARYVTLKTTESPMKFGLPEKLTPMKMPSAEEFSNRPRWTDKEANNGERNKPFILVPKEACFNEVMKWCGQSWAVSPAIGDKVRNFIMKSYGHSGEFVMARPQMDVEGIIDLQFLITSKFTDPKTGQVWDFLKDLRMDGNGESHPRVDTALYIDKGRPGSVFFIYSLLTGEYYRTPDGLYDNVVVSEGGDSGVVNPIDENGQTGYGIAGVMRLKPDREDSPQEITFRWGPVDRAGVKMNLVDARRYVGR